MELKKRQLNGSSSSSGQKKKKKKTLDVDEENLESKYFQSEIVYHSTVTKMKVNSLLTEVTLKENQRQDIEQFIRQLTNEIQSIPQGTVRELSAMSEWLTKFDIQIPLTYSKMLKTFEFIPPTFIQPIGSYTSNTLIVKSSTIVIDLLVEIPHKCIHKKDYLNNEYFEKRSIYLCYLAKKFKQYSLEFGYLNQTTENQIVLFVKPNESSNFAIRIRLAPEQDYLNEKRLKPQSSNLRWKWFDDKFEQDEPFYSTPNYNSAILYDCHLRLTSDYLKNLFLSSNELTHALKLFKIWLEQRQLTHGFGSFDGAMSAFFLAYLLHINKINKQMYSYQIFRIALVGLSKTKEISFVF